MDKDKPRTSGSRYRNRISPPHLHAVVEDGLREGETCRYRGLRTLGVTPDERTITFEDGEPAVCNLPHRPTSYARRSRPGIVWVCPGLAYEPDWLIPFILIHEQAHAIAGVADDPQDEHGHNRRIARACRQ